MVDPSPIEYYRSLAAELTASADRMRSLIGHSHFLSDGHHKEYLVRALLSRYLPKSVDVGSGFVVDSIKFGSVSREQDVLIIDSDKGAALYCENGLFVSTGSTVLGAISVKSRLKADQVKDMVGGLLSVLDPMGLSGRFTEVGMPFFGGVAFESSTKNSKTTAKWFARGIAAAELTPAVLRSFCTPWLFCVLSTAELVAIGPVEQEEIPVRVFQCETYALAVWISSLIHHVLELRSLVASVRMPSLEAIELPRVAEARIQVKG